MTLLSVIIPVYNREHLVQASVESVLSQIGSQTEIILINDGSTDNTQRVIESLSGPIVAIEQSHRGVSAARNRGIEAAQGTLFAFLDSDDLWAAQKLSLQFPYLERVEIAVGHLAPFSSDSSLPTSDQPVFFASFGAGLFRRDVFDKVGPLDEELRYCEDLDWFLRAREAGISIGIHREVVLHCRQHQGNSTHQKTLKELNLLRVMQQSIRRREGLSLPPYIDLEGHGPFLFA